MRIVMVGPFAFYPKGTVYVRMMPIAEVLQSRGHEISIVLPPYDNLAESGREYKVRNIPIYNVKIPRAFSPIKQFLTAERLVRKALELNPDIIHVFKPMGYSGLGAMLLILRRWLRLAKIPIVLDSDDWEGRGGFYEYFLSHQLYPRYQLNFMLFQVGWVPKHVDAITVASKTLQAQVWSLGIPADRVFYVPNGPHYFDPPREGLDREVLQEKFGLSGAPVVLLYTRFFEFDVGRVIDILKLVKQEMERVKLLVVGKGDFGEEEELAELAESHGIRDSVVFAGWIEPEELPAYLELGDVAIYPFNDTLLNRAKCPGKLVELMSLGKAIVADRVGQIAEYIENERSGILADSGDTESFAQNVLRLLQDENLRARLGENAKARIWNVFNWDRLTSEVEAAYKAANLVNVAVR